MVMPSDALIPATPFCETRTAGGGGKVVTCCDPCPLWQSAQVACRLLLSSTSSVASWVLFPAGKGCPTLENSAKTLGMAGVRFVPPLWQPTQSCSFGPCSNRAGPSALCGVWQEMHALLATVP